MCVYGGFDARGDGRLCRKADICTGVEVLSAAHRDPASWRLEPASLQRQQPYDCPRYAPDRLRPDGQKTGLCQTAVELEIVALDSVVAKACESGLV